MLPIPRRSSEDPVISAYLNAGNGRSLNRKTARFLGSPEINKINPAVLPGGSGELRSRPPGRTVKSVRRPWRRAFSCE